MRVASPSFCLVLTLSLSLDQLSLHSMVRPFKLLPCFFLTPRPHSQVPGKNPLDKFVNSKSCSWHLVSWRSEDHSLPFPSLLSFTLLPGEQHSTTLHCENAHVCIRYGKKNMLWYISVCSMIGGISVSVTTGLGAAIVTTAMGDSQVCFTRCFSRCYY